jgi:vitamin K-dependent gamma-carboxylase
MGHGSEMSNGGDFNTSLEVSALPTGPLGVVARYGWRVRTAGTRQVSAASVAVFRIAFGLSIIVNAALYVPRVLREHHIEPTFHFSYGPVDFLEPLPGVGMYFVYGAMMVVGALIAVGVWYRWAASLFFVLTTYVFLLDATFYQNHEYLISLLAALMVLLPVNGFWSMDANAGRTPASDVIPAWVVWLLRFQIGVPYFFGGVAKLNSGWLHGEPLRTWMAVRTDLEPMRTVLANSSVIWFMVYGALILDLLVVPLLLYRRTRAAAFAAVCLFHFVNVWLFGLYIFPWLMMAATLIFFSPDWPLRALRRVGWSNPVLNRRTSADNLGAPNTRRTSAPLTTLLILWVILQLVIPLRHFTIEGSPSWTEEGHRFAWHMMLRDKSGTARFNLTDGERTWTVDPAGYLTAEQVRELAWYPEHLVKFAHHLSSIHGGAEVRVDTSVSLNGRDPQPIVDPTVDLAAVPKTWWGHAPWIVQLADR